MLKRGEKGIIYCQSRYDSEIIAGKLDIPFYHSEISKEERKEAVTIWLDSSKTSKLPWISATSGFGTGLDFPQVKSIIHYGVPYGFLDFIQQTGRAGREEGSRTSSLTILKPSDLKGKAPFLSDIDSRNWDGLEAFITSKTCRRLVISGFFDGRNSTCDSLGAIPYNNCQNLLEQPSIKGISSISSQNQVISSENQLISI